MKVFASQTLGARVEETAATLVQRRIPVEEGAVMRALEAMGLRSWATDWRFDLVIDAMTDMRRDMPRDPWEGAR